MNTLRIAAAVVRAPIGAKEENLAGVTHWTKSAAEKGCRLICFPEMNITGYCNKAAMGRVRRNDSRTCKRQAIGTCRRNRADHPGRHG